MNLMTTYLTLVVYQYVHYADTNKDDEYIDQFRMSVLTNTNTYRDITHLYGASHIEFEGYGHGSDTSIFSTVRSPYGVW